MTLSAASSSAFALDWNFSQVFGEQVPGEDVQEVDIISAVEFDKSGDYIAVGDRGGRIVIFEKKLDKDVESEHLARAELEQMDFSDSQHPEFQYKIEFQSHEPEFDYLKSVEIEEKINKLRWCPTLNGALFILATNDKTVKLWKVKENKVKKVKEVLNPYLCSENMLLAEKSFVSDGTKPPTGNNHLLEWTDNKASGSSSSHEEHSAIGAFEDAATPRCRKVYAHAHDFNINSISNNSDGETFLSADDLRINLWNFEVSNQCFNIIDMKPTNMDDLIEVITSAEFHPRHCNLFAYSSSRGFIRLVDMRQSALCDQGAKIFQDAESRGPKSFFSEIIASISDIKFSSDARHILSRDFMSLKLWDVRMETSPVATYTIHEHLRPKLPELYNNDAIFDKFDCCLSGDGLHLATGSYSNSFRIFSHGVGSDEGVTIEASRKAFRKQSTQTARRARRSSLSNLTRGFYRQGDFGVSLLLTYKTDFAYKQNLTCHENSSSAASQSACDLKSKLLHMSWHPSDNLIACSAGSSLFLYHA